MEKSKAHYRLTDIQAIVTRDGLAAFTATALFNRLAMGLSDAVLLQSVADMKPTMFQKSMTTYRDHKIWQDVYHVPLPNGMMAYVKLTLQAGAVVIQFKNQEG
jgi:motility quorum-sensing regulator/GCU-specific mRNA interferase toxin